MPSRGTVTAYTVPRTEQDRCSNRSAGKRGAGARRIAAKYAEYDAAQVPLIHPILRVGEDYFGDFYLSWRFYQVLDPSHEVHVTNSGYTAEVDAITGYGRPGPARFSAGMGVSRLANPHRIAAAPYAGIKIKTLDGSNITPIDRPTMEKGVVWSRVEALRGIGTDVSSEKAKLTISFGGKNITNQSAGARYHDHGWWIPLKSTLESLGLQMEWSAESKTATIQCKAVQPLSGGKPPAPATPQ